MTSALIFFNECMAITTLDRTFREQIIRWMVESTVDDSPYHWCADYMRLVPPEKRNRNSMEPLECADCVTCWMVEDICPYDGSNEEKEDKEKEKKIRQIKENCMEDARKNELRSDAIAYDGTGINVARFENRVNEFFKCRDKILEKLQNRCEECGQRGVMKRSICVCSTLYFCGPVCQRKNWNRDHRGTCSRHTTTTSSTTTTTTTTTTTITSL